MNQTTKTMITKKRIILSLFLVGILAGSLTGAIRISSSGTNIHPEKSLFSRFHTLTIHIKDPAVHDSVFHFLKDKLQLPVYYQPLTLGNRKYAGVFAGNLVLEPCGPYTQFNYKTDFKAIFFGLNFETDDSISSVAKVLENLNMKYEIYGNEYIYLQDTDVSGENTFIGISNRQEKEKDHSKLDSLRSVMNSNIESDLGIEYVKEVLIGYANDSNLNQWKELISPSELKPGNVWELNKEMNFRFIQGSIKEVKGITFKVKSLEKAKMYAKENGLFGTEYNGAIAIDPKKSFGLSICFTE